MSQKQERIAGVVMAAVRATIKLMQEGKLSPEQIEARISKRLNSPDELGASLLARADLRQEAAADYLGGGEGE